jgi:histidinol-phosphate phosphatase family protein
MSAQTDSRKKGPWGRKAVFLDRDGVILEERGYLANPDEVILLDGAASAIRMMADLGLRVVVVTNQSGIGRGFFTEEDYRRVKDRMDTLLALRGAKTDAEYCCPHAPWESCSCRKPEPGLALRAAGELGLDLTGSFVVGDKASDMEMSREIGARSILVRTGYGLETERTSEPVWDAVVDGIGEAVEVIRGWIAEGRGESLRKNDRGATMIREAFQETAKVLLDFRDKGEKPILDAARLIADSMERGGTLLLCGNGGSAADCQHMAAEFVCRLSAKRNRRALPALALSTDTSFLTAFCNDYGFADVFLRQVQALGRPGDVLVGISTGGTSENVVRAMREARVIGISTIALTRRGGAIGSLADVSIEIDAEETAILQNAHLAVEHVLCALVEEIVFGGEEPCSGGESE